ncbi:CHAT domain-containing protein [Crucibulum laeve]|uniref:CHAT domain-containing protein n=1 Tax=Crucibulum laeve TaxID=68775 RepID=A0A5C3LX53_9AGAR|nr:CHAT domain-containing protein [Crucibulum laeve]
MSQIPTHTTIIPSFVPLDEPAITESVIRQYSLSDLHLECASQGSEFSNNEELVLSVTPNDLNIQKSVTFKRFSLASWKCEDTFKILSGKDALNLTLFRSVEEIGHISFTPERLSQCLQENANNSNVKFIVETGEGNEGIVMLFRINDVSTSDENPSHLLDYALEVADDNPYKWLLLARAADCFNIRSTRTTALSDMNEAISTYEASVLLSPDAHPHKVVLLNRLGQAYIIRYSKTGDAKDVDQAISRQRSAISLVSSDDEEVRLGVLTSFGNHLMCRFGYSKDQTDFEDSISAFKSALDLSSKNIPGPHASIIMSCIAGLYHLRFQHLRSINDITEAINAIRDAIKLLAGDDPILPSLLSNLAGSLMFRFGISGAREDMIESMSAIRKAIDLTSDHNINKPNLLSNLAGSYVLQFQQTRILADVDEAIALRRKAIVLMHNGHRDMPFVLCNLGNTFLRRWELTNDLEDINQAIEIHRKGHQLTPVGHVELRLRLLDQRNLLLFRLRQTHQPADRDEAIALIHRAITIQARNVGSDSFDAEQLRLLRALSKEKLQKLAIHDEDLSVKQVVFETTPAEDSESILEVLDEMVSIHMECYELLMESTDIEKAVDLQRKAIQLTHPSDVMYLIRLEKLGVLLWNKVQHTRDKADLDDCIAVHRDILDKTSKEDHDWRKRINHLAHVLVSTIVQHPGQPQDKVTAGWNTLDFILNSFDQDTALFLSEQLATLITRRFELSGDPEEAETAISLFQRALSFSVTPEHQKQQLSHLCTMHLRRFQRTGMPSDLDAASTAQQRRMDLTPNDNDDEMPMMLDALGSVSLHRFKLTGKPDDLYEAIRLQRKALSLDPINDKLMSNLGNSLLRLFEITGELRDIDECISLQQNAVYNTQSGDDISMRISVNNLGNAFTCRYGLTRERGDITEALSAYGKALVLFPERSQDRVLTMDNMASCYYQRFRCENNVNDLDDCISIRKKALGFASADHIIIPALLFHLGNSLLDRYSIKRNLEDIDDAIDTLKRSMTVTQVESYLLRPYALSGMGNAFFTRFQVTGNLDDLDHAIIFQTTGLASIPKNHIDYNIGQIYLGRSLERRFRRTKNIEDYEQAVFCYQSGANYPNGRALDRLMSARQWGALCRHIDPHQSLLAYGIAIEVLPQVAWLGQTVDQRLERLTDISTLPNEAAATALDLDRLDLALEWLEQGRSILWSQLDKLQAHNAMDNLRLKAPDLADELQRISIGLEISGGRTDDLNGLPRDMAQKMSNQKDAQQHHQLADEWNSILKNIRDVDGFESFLLPTKSSELLKSIPKSGPVIVINVHGLRCDALALLSWADTPIHIPLEKLTYEKAVLWQEQLGIHLAFSDIIPSIRSGRPFTAPLAKMSFESILAELWKCVVKPILDALAYSPTLEPSRLWWCTTGPLAFLPLHAAGMYGSRGSSVGSIISDFVVSSYTPTVSAIIKKTRNNHINSDSRSRGILVVSQASTPNLAKISNTVQECMAVVEKCALSGLEVEYLEEESGTVESVLQGMEQHAWIHLACHAIQNLENPISSAFYLHNGPLAISAIIKKPLPHADFAFLSACQTSTGDTQLSEESIHLAAGMLSAGYRSIIATMWSIDDMHAPVIADQVYSHLLEDQEDSENLDSSRAAYALHYATKALRERLGNSETAFLLWVPFIHMGF